MSEEKKISPIEDDLKLRGVSALRSAASGWKAMQKGIAPNRNERILKESAKPNGDQNDTVGFRPGFDDDAPSERVSQKKLQEAQKEIKKRLTLTGNTEQLILKLQTLLEKNKTVTITSVEEAGFMNYKLECLV